MPFLSEMKKEEEIMETDSLAEDVESKLSAKEDKGIFSSRVSGH